jgi:hypothetical protein
MPGQYPEAAGGIFAAQRQHPVLIDDHRERRDDAQPHEECSVLAAAASF